MLKYTLPPMRPEQVVCPNSACGASGRIGVHSHKERRYDEALITPVIEQSRAAALPGKPILFAAELTESCLVD